MGHRFDAIPLERLKQALTRLDISVVKTRQTNNSDITLWSGNAGLALHLCSLQQICPEAVHEGDILALLDGILNEISIYPENLLPGNIWSIWATREVSKFLGNAEYIHFCNDFDELLLEDLNANATWNHSWDLISGLTSVGAYGLCANTTPLGKQIVERVIELLLPLSCQDKLHQWWPTQPEFGSPSMLTRHPKGYVDLGLAHGNAGLILFFATCIKNKIAQEIASGTLEKLVPWLMAQQNPSESPARFPYIVQEKNIPSRCAWCYGDVGVAWALLCAGSALQNPIWLESAFRTAQCVTNRAIESMGFVDSALCHGHAGVGHIMRRMAHYFNDDRLEAFSQAMLFLAFQSLETNTSENRANTSFLEGNAGIALALISAHSLPEPAWDFPLLLG